MVNGVDRVDEVGKAGLGRTLTASLGYPLGEGQPIRGGERLREGWGLCSL